MPGHGTHHASGALAAVLQAADVLPRAVGLQPGHQRLQRAAVHQLLPLEDILVEEAPGIPARPADTCDTQQRPGTPVRTQRRVKPAPCSELPKAPRAPGTVTRHPEAPAPSPLARPLPGLCTGSPLFSFTFQIVFLYPSHTKMSHVSCVFNVLDSTSTEILKGTVRQAEAGPPQECRGSHLEPATLLPTWQRHFADAIKLRSLRWGYPGLSTWAQCHHRALTGEEGRRETAKQAG